jgi:hypothetical protein
LKTDAFILVLVFCLFAPISQADVNHSNTLPEPVPDSAVRLSGHLADDRLVECSGMDISLATAAFFWAVNDGGDGPFIYAVGFDGRSLGRVAVAGARNRDWEGLDSFLWHGRPMLLIADFGDNEQTRDTHTLYIVEEPRLIAERFDPSASIDVAWRVVFSYPDGGHDAEGVAVDATAGKVILLTKRDEPPLLFELPLKPLSPDHPLVARRITVVDRIPPPSSEDLRHEYGQYRSQPTALDISPDGRQAVVLTYKHAYRFSRRHADSWTIAFDRPPLVIPLPLPHERNDLRQREAICFAPDGMALYVTSEGRGAGIFLIDTR